MEVGRHFPHTFGLGFPPPLSNSSFPPPPFGFLPLSRGSFAKGVDCKVKHRGKGKVLIYALKLPRIFHSVQPAPTRYGDRNHCPPYIKILATPLAKLRAHVTLCGLRQTDRQGDGRTRMHERLWIRLQPLTEWSNHFPLGYHLTI